MEQKKKSYLMVLKETNYDKYLECLAKIRIVQMRWRKKNKKKMEILYKRFNEKRKKTQKERIYEMFDNFIKGKSYGEIIIKKRRGN